MGSFSDFLENEALDHVLSVGAYTPPTIYVGLSTTTVTDASTGATVAEPASANAYARVACATWNAASGRTTSNTNVVTFATATTATWGTITDWFLSNSGTRAAGDILAYGTLAVSKEVIVGNTASFAAGELDVTISASGSGGGWSDLLCNEMLDHIFGNGSYTAPTLYVALSTVTPEDDSSPAGTEPVGNNYARKAVGACSAASGGTSDNDAQILFDTPSGSWGTITHCVITNHLSTALGPTINLMWGQVSSQLVGSGDTVDFPAGDLNFSLS